MREFDGKIEYHNGGSNAILLRPMANVYYPRGLPLSQNQRLWAGFCLGLRGSWIQNNTTKANKKEKGSTLKAMV